MTNQWIIPVNTDAEVKYRLFCFPFSGGGTTAYRKWRPDINPEIEMDLFCYPGREMRFREPAIVDFERLKQQLYDEIITKTDLPYAFYGHSYGGIAAFSVAQMLYLAKKTLPSHLVISARAAPDLMPQKKLSDIKNDEEFIQTVIELYQGIPDVVLNNPDLLAMFIPILHNDFKLYENYSYIKTEPLPTPIIVFGFEEDKIEAPLLQSWKNFTSKEFEYISLPGGHFEILEDWTAITDKLNQVISA